MGSGTSKPSPKFKSKYELHRFLKHDGSINCMALSIEGTVLLTGGDDCTIRIWSTNTTPVECLGVLTGHRKYITCLAIEGNYALSGSADFTLRKWDMGTCECLLVFEGHSNVINRVISIDCHTMFSTSSDQTARAWSLKRRRDCDLCVRIFQGHTKAVYSVIYVNGTRNIVEATEDILITSSMDGTARSWSIKQGIPIHVFKGHDGPIQSISISDDCKILFTGSTDTTIKAWNISNGKLVRTFQGHTGPVVSITVTPKVLYTAGVDKTARSWVIEFGSCTKVYRGHKHTISSIMYYNGFIFTACGDGFARCFDAKTGFIKRIFKGHFLAVTAMQLAAGRLFTGSVDKTFRVWSLDNLVDDAGNNIMDVAAKPKQLINKNDEPINFVPRNPISGAAEVPSNMGKIQIMLDNPNPYKMKQTNTEEISNV